MSRTYLPLFLFIIYLSAASAWAQTTNLLPVGTWTNADQEAKFEIYKCGEELCGKIVWLKEPLRNGKPKTDDKNPDEKLRNRPLLSMVYMKGFEYVGEQKWDNGTIYDPKSGKTYSCYLKMLGKDKMEVKGYIGFSMIGRSQIWTRVQ